MVIILLKCFHIQIFVSTGKCGINRFEKVYHGFLLKFVFSFD